MQIAPASGKRAAALAAPPPAAIGQERRAGRHRDRGLRGNVWMSAATTGKPAQGRTAGTAEIQTNKRGSIDTNPPRGTRDFFPQDMRLRNWLFDHFRSVSSAFGFEEFDSPVLESEDLFVRKAGEDITDQLYNFEDKGGRRVALRPELTPSLARMVLSKGKGLLLPAKWFAVGQCWRYERTTRGRRREHYQWNMDIIGVEGQEAEAELLAAITMFFERVGLGPEDVQIRISSRKVLEGVLRRYNVPVESFGPVCVVVDKIDKLPEQEVVRQLSNLGLDSEAVNGVLSATEARSMPELQELLGSDSEAVKEMVNLFGLADGYGIKDWLTLDTSVVRGLAYYTGIVFEAIDRRGMLRAICGGGRYDRIMGTFGGDNLPCAGFGFGDAVIVELLKDKGHLPDLDHQVDDVVVALDESLRPQASGLANSLRKTGRNVDLVLEEKKMKWIFRHAERLSAKRLVIVGATEWERGCVRVKQLAKREESDVPVQQLCSVSSDEAFE